MESKTKQHRPHRRYLSLVLAITIFALIASIIIFVPLLQNNSVPDEPTPDNSNIANPVNEPETPRELPTVSPSPKDTTEQNSNTNTAAGNTSENTQSNPATESNWALNMINAPAAWSESTGAGVKIAILDTGVGPIDDVKVYGGYNFVDNNEDTTDRRGHGTMVASIIAATHTNSKTGLKGVAPDAKIYAVKIIDDQGNMNINRAVAGVRWAIYNDMQIISMSWCINDGNYALRQVLAEAYNKGILLVAAAGNSGQIAYGVGCPAEYDTTIAVTAVKESTRQLEEACSGPQIELSAPGEKVWVIGLDNTLYTNKGTSFATAYITGTAALVWAKNPTLTNIEVRNILCQTATDLQPNDGLNRDIYFGYGLVNAATAVQITPNSPQP